MELPFVVGKLSEVKILPFYFFEECLDIVFCFNEFVIGKHESIKIAHNELSEMNAKLLNPGALLRNGPYLRPGLILILNNGRSNKKIHHIS